MIPQQPNQPPGYADRQFLHAETAAVNVPIKQVIVTSVFAALAILTLSLMFHARHPFENALYSLGIMPLVMWMYLQRRWLILTAEKVFQTDINRDDVIGEPVTRNIRVQISEIKTDGHYQAQTIELPATDEQMSALADGLAHGKPLTEREWAGKGKPFSSRGFRELHVVMVKRGLLQPKSDKDLRRGYDLTEAGRALFADYLTSPTADTVPA